MELSVIQVIAIYAIPVIFAITLHEAAHGYVARLFGDDTVENFEMFESLMHDGLRVVVALNPAC